MSGVGAGALQRPDVDLRGVLRGLLLSAQHLLRERFEERVTWVDGKWQWRREAAGAAPAPALPPEARKKVADVSRLFEILTNAQFRDQPVAKVSPAAAQSFVPPSRQLPDPMAASRDDDCTALLVCALLLLVGAFVWLAVVVLHRRTCRGHVAEMKRYIKGWFTKKTATADGQTEVVQTQPRDDPPPPYSDTSVEPFLPPGGAAATVVGTEDLPPPYTSGDASDCKDGTSDDQRQSLIDIPGANPGTDSAAPENHAAQTGTTRDEDRSNPDNKASCDSSLVVVV